MAISLGIHPIFRQTHGNFWSFAQPLPLAGENPQALQNLAVAGRIAAVMSERQTGGSGIKTFGGEVLGLLGQVRLDLSSVVDTSKHELIALSCCCPKCQHILTRYCCREFTIYYVYYMGLWWSLSAVSQSFASLSVSQTALEQNWAVGTCRNKHILAALHLHPLANIPQKHMGLSENSVPLNPMVNDHYP